MCIRDSESDRVNSGWYYFVLKSMALNYDFGRNPFKAVKGIKAVSYTHLRRRPSMLRFTLLWTKFHLYPVRIRYVFLSKMILILRILVR